MCHQACPPCVAAKPVHCRIHRWFSRFRFWRLCRSFHAARSSGRRLRLYGSRSPQGRNRRAAAQHPHPAGPRLGERLGHRSYLAAWSARRERLHHELAGARADGHRRPVALEHHGPDAIGHDRPPAQHRRRELIRCPSDTRLERAATVSHCVVFDAEQHGDGVHLLEATRGVAGSGISSPGRPDPVPDSRCRNRCVVTTR
jgi:hypothetical protein